MRELLHIQKKLVPELLESMQKRYTLLRTVSYLQPIGRRALAQALHSTERILRAEVDWLREVGLLHVTAAGMSCTEEGLHLLRELEDLAPELFGLNELAHRLQTVLGIPQVIVVQGDADQQEWVKRELGRTGARILREKVREGDVIAVTGGSTIASVADSLPPASVWKNVWFVPARGGLGEKVELQANTLAAAMAGKTGGHYRLLHVPDRLQSEEILSSLLADPAIREVLEMMRSARIVLHGIGDAVTMARRRKYSEPEIRELQASGALSEAFGYYFDGQGNIVERMPTIGLQLEDVKRMEAVISIAGGASKAKAILSFAKQSCQHVLITDEGAARAILASLAGKDDK